MGGARRRAKPAADTIHRKGHRLTTQPAAFDVIGDVHGMILTLREMVAKLGYRRRGGRWFHPEQRQLISVGDVLDRGPDPLGCLELIAQMVGDGCAQMVLGNHEINAVHYQRGLREHSDKNTKQFKATLKQIEESPGRWRAAEAFLERCPTRLLLDEGRLRIIHAYWDGLPAAQSAHVATDLPEYINSQPLWEATAAGGALHPLVEDCLKGPEEQCEPFHDKDGHLRHHHRIPWWRVYPAEAPVVVFGHYWFPWKNSDLTPTEPASLGPGQNAVCLDYSVGRGGRLVAMRYPERELTPVPCQDPR